MLILGLENTGIVNYFTTVQLSNPKIAEKPTS